MELFLSVVWEGLVMCWINPYRQRSLLFPLNYSQSSFHFSFSTFLSCYWFTSYTEGQTKSFYSAFLLDEKQKEEKTLSTCIDAWFCQGLSWKVKRLIYLSYKIIKLKIYVYVYFMCKTLRNNMYAILYNNFPK